MGLILKYVMNNYKSVRLDFADSIALSEDGCLEERVSPVLLNMNNRGLISSRSDVIALLSGELLELRTETSYLFKVS